MSNLQIATLAGGCFWCLEAIYQRLKGVEKVTSGYTGGKRPNPTWEQVSTGATGHAEAVQIHFDPQATSYRQLLEIFFALHNPTTLNCQGANVGTEYRSAIFYHNESQKHEAEAIIQELEQKKVYANSIVTEIVPFDVFYPAEVDHYRFYDRNKAAPYCRIVIDPKIQKLLKEYQDMVKKDYQ